MGHAGLYSETPPQKPKAELLFVSGKEQSEDSVCLISAGDTEARLWLCFMVSAVISTGCFVHSVVPLGQGDRKGQEWFAGDRFHES